MKRIASSLTFGVLLIVSLQAQNNALSFDGSNDQVSLSYSTMLDFSLNDKFTIEGWFKSTSYTAVIFSNLVDQSPFIGYEVALVASRLVFSQTNTDLTNQIRIETINSFNDGNWHHFACIYRGIPNAANEDIYVDGILQSQNVTSNNLTSAFNSGNASHIGSRNNTAYFMNGAIDEIRIWRRALCQNEIVSRKNCQLIGNEIDLIAYFNFNQGTAASSNNGITTLPDVSGNNNTGTLTGFALNGSTSNWVNSNSVISGICGPVTQLQLAISGNTIMCVGSSNVFHVGGANSYTWSTLATTSSLVVSPTITTTYSVTGSNATKDCQNSAVITLVVSPCTALEDQLNDKEMPVVFPNPGSGLYKLSGIERDAVIYVYNFAGALIYKVVSEKTEAQIDLNNFSDGMYFLSVATTHGNQRTYKLVKK